MTQWDYCEVIIHWPAGDYANGEKKPMFIVKYTDSGRWGNFTIEDKDTLFDAIAILGEYRWELVASNGGAWAYLKRPSALEWYVDKEGEVIT